MADPEKIIGHAADLLDRRGMVATCYIAMVLMTQALYSAPTWHSWERPDFIFGVLVLSLGAAHGSYEACLWLFQTFVSDRVASYHMEKNALSTGTSKEEAKPRNIDGDDLREFREWLLKDAAPRTRSRIETHENARRNSTYLFTSSLAAIALASALPFIDSRVKFLPLGVYLLLATLTLLWFFGSVYRSFCLGRDLGIEFRRIEFRNNPKAAQELQRLATKLGRQKKAAACEGC